MTMQELGVLRNVADFGRLTPMKDIVSGDGGLTTVFTSLDDPNRIVKEVDTLWWMQQGYMNSYSQDQFVQFVAEPINIITSSDHAISRFIPPVEVAWGMGQDGERGFVVMPRVSGDELVNMKHIDHRTAAQMDELIAAALHVDMSVGQLAGKMRVRPDIIRNMGQGHRINNIIVGTIEPGGVSQPWIHDVYPAHYFTQFANIVVQKKDWQEALTDLRGRSDGFAYPLAELAINEFYSSGPRETKAA